MNNDHNSRSGQPENDPSKAMDSGREVAQSNDEKTDQDFPGYPHYPAKEDIMDQRTGAHRVDANLEDMGSGPNASGVNQRFLAGNEDRMSTGANAGDEAEGETGFDDRNDEIGVPQNVSNEELNEGIAVAGTDIDEAAEKGSTNP